MNGIGTGGTAAPTATAAPLRPIAPPPQRSPVADAAASAGDAKSPVPPRAFATWLRDTQAVAQASTGSGSPARGADSEPASAAAATPTAAIDAGETDADGGDASAATVDDATRREGEPPSPARTRGRSIAVRRDAAAMRPLAADAASTRDGLQAWRDGAEQSGTAPTDGLALLAAFAPAEALRWPQAPRDGSASAAAGPAPGVDALAAGAVGSSAASATGESMHDSGRAAGRGAEADIDARMPADTAGIGGAPTAGAAETIAPGATMAATAGIAMPTPPLRPDPPASTPTAAATVPEPVGSPEFPGALGVRLSVLARDGVQHAELHLNPAEMGPLAIRIALDGESARIDFAADHATTRQAIEHGLPELAAALRDAGFTLSGGGVSAGDPRSEAADAAAGDAGRAARGQAGAAGEAAGEGARPRGTTIRAGGVDTYA